MTLRYITSDMLIFVTRKHTIAHKYLGGKYVLQTETY